MPRLRPIVTTALVAALLAIAPAHAAERAVPAPVATPLPPVDLAPLMPPVTLPALTPTPMPDVAPVTAASRVRTALVALAMKLREVRYVRGGHSPSTGFDCSGFVRYVFAQAIGLHLPPSSARQFLAGIRIRRDQMQPGDLVFFHTRGRKRISHVGIYLDNGRFIHSPSAGKSVEVSRLDDAYWARRFAGARRPEGIVGQHGFPLSRD